MTIFSSLSANSIIGKVVQSAEVAVRDNFENLLRERIDEEDVDRIDVSEFLGLEASNIKQVRKRIRHGFERRAKNFMNDEPEIVFVAEYIVEGEFLGALLVWEKYFDATHYEIFKRNVFSQDPEFDRILFLDKANLEEERARLIPYIKEDLGFEDINEEDFLIFFDHRAKEDRIYEYKVKATRVPIDAKDVDYDLAMESQDLLTTITISDTSTAGMFDFAGATLGSEDLAWVFALLNENVKFFGRQSSDKSLPEMMASLGGASESGEYNLLVPRNMGDLLSIISESVALFGIRKAFGHIADVMGGLTKEFRCTLVDALDETRNVFSYDRFRTVITHQLPVFQLLLNLSESGSKRDKRALSQLPITLPSNTGSEEINSLDGLSKVFKFVNDSLLVALYSQDEENFAKIKQIIEDIAVSQGLETDPVDDAVGEIRDEEADEASTTTVSVDAAEGSVGSSDSEQSSVDYLGVSDGSTAPPPSAASNTAQASSTSDRGAAAVSAARNRARILIRQG
jgi:hypothetical protein